MKNTTIRGILLKSAEAALGFQRADGSFPPGHNGPWNSAETPVRVTSHWIILLLKAYELSHKKSYAKAIENACAYLMSRKARPHHFAFRCCISRDAIAECNGLIGQAWALEAILQCAEFFQEKRFSDFLGKCLSRFTYDRKSALWNILSVKGKILRQHFTLNQQIWFSVMAFRIAKLTGDKRILDECEHFFNNLIKTIRFNDGYIDMLVNERTFLREPARYLEMKIYRIRRKNSLPEQSLGYLSFTLYGLALAYQSLPHSPIWKNEKMRRYISQSIRQLDDSMENRSLCHNEYSFSYHPTGFEIVFVKRTFRKYISGSSKNEETWLQRQIESHYDFSKNTMSKNTSDPATLSARLYESARIIDRNQKRIK